MQHFFTFLHFAQNKSLHYKTTKQCAVHRWGILSHFAPVNEIRCGTTLCLFCACLKTSVPKQPLLNLKSGDFVPHEPKYGSEVKIRVVKVKVRWSIHGNIEVDITLVFCRRSWTNLEVPYLTIWCNFGLCRYQNNLRSS